MANPDKPFGFRFHSTRHGGPPRVTKYKNTAVAIYPGDVVHLDGSGRVNSITDGEAGMGVALNYVSATAGQDVYVMDDLQNTLFTVQCDGADIADDTAIGNYFDITVTTGNTTTLQGQQELDTSDSTHDQLQLIGLVNKPGNDWGIHADVIVRFHVDTSLQIAAVTA